MHTKLKAFLISLATLIIPTSTFASTPEPVAVLKPSNTLTLLGVIDEPMVELVARKLPKLTSNTIYVQLLSPGGSVLAGKRIIDQLLGVQAQGKKIVCVAHVAVSMAFVILQSPACSVRQVVSGAVLMQHQASATVEGPVLHLLSQVRSLLLELDELNKMQADRLQMPLKQFLDSIAHDMWLNSGNAAIAAKAADAQIAVVCSPSLLNEGRKEELVYGKIKLVATFSDCPYIVQPKVEVLPSDSRKGYIRDIRM